MAAGIKDSAWHLFSGLTHPSIEIILLYMLAFRVCLSQLVSVKRHRFYLAFDGRDLDCMKTYKVQGQKELRKNEYKYVNLSVPTGFPTCGVRLNENDRWCFSRQPSLTFSFSLPLNCSNPSSHSTHADIVLGVNMVEIFSLLRMLDINCSPAERDNSNCLQFPTCCEQGAFYIWHFLPLLCAPIFISV